MQIPPRALKTFPVSNDGSLGPRLSSSFTRLNTFVRAFGRKAMPYLILFSRVVCILGHCHYSLWNYKVELKEK